MPPVARFSVKKTHIKQNLIFGGFFKKGYDFLLVMSMEKRFFLIKQNKI